MPRRGGISAPVEAGFDLLLQGVIKQQRAAISRDPWLPRSPAAVTALLEEALRSGALDIHHARGVVGLLESDGSVRRLIGPVVPPSLPWREEAKSLIDELAGKVAYRGFRVKVAVNSEYHRYWALLEESGYRRYNAEMTMLIERGEWNVYSKREPWRRGGVIVRRYEANDGSVVRRIHPEDAYFSAETVIDRGAQGLGGILIVEGELWGRRRPVGYLYHELTEGHGEICFVNVDEAARGRGFGSRLINAALDYLFWEAGAEAVEISVRPDNPAADLYRRIGFSPIVTYYSYQRLL